MIGQVIPTLIFGALAGLLVSCDSLAKAPTLSKPQGQRLELGCQVPQTSERDAIGDGGGPVERSTPRFRTLKQSLSPEIVFKDEERGGCAVRRKRKM